jgi:hypothetical protein
VPDGPQLSASVVLQLVHALPWMPQVASDRGRQTPAWQQPLGHDVELHSHAPFTHTVPAPHGAPVPQRHAPDVQRSEVVGSHGAHAMPPVPHAPKSGVVSHVAPVQQPVEQFVLLQPEHAPLIHVCPAGQS